MGLFSETECRHCGSRDHASDNCPHDKGFVGLFSEAKCRHCGSKEHASDDCPHDKGFLGLLSETKCRHCGSKNHATNNCPHLTSLDNRDTHLSSTIQEATPEEGILDSLVDKAARIGWILGAIGGFAVAVESANELSDYFINIVIGGVIGGIVGGTMVAILPWAIGAAILTLILKACGFG